MMVRAYRTLQTQKSAARESSGTREGSMTVLILQEEAGGITTQSLPLHPISATSSVAKTSWKPGDMGSMGLHPQSNSSGLIDHTQGYTNSIGQMKKSSTGILAINMVAKDKAVAFSPLFILPKAVHREVRLLSIG